MADNYEQRDFDNILPWKNFARRPRMSTADLFGYIAATLTTTAFIPQAWLTWKRKQTEGVSLGMYLIFTTGVGAWMFYGLLLHSGPIILANAFTLALALFILIMKVRYG